MESPVCRHAVNIASAGAPRGRPCVDGEKLVNDPDNVTSTFAATSRVSRIRRHGYLPEPVVVSVLLYCSEIAIEIQSLDDLPTGRLSRQELIQ